MILNDNIGRLLEIISYSKVVIRILAIHIKSTLINISVDGFFLQNYPLGEHKIPFSLKGFKFQVF